MRGDVRVLSLSLSLVAAIFLACDQGDSGNTQSGQLVYRAIYLPFGQAVPIEVERSNPSPGYTFTSYERDGALSHLDADARSFQPVSLLGIPWLLSSTWGVTKTERTFCRTGTRWVTTELSSCTPNNSSLQSQHPCPNPDYS